MTSLDTRIRPKVVALLERYGKDALFRVETRGTYDATTGDTTPSFFDHTAKISPPERADGMKQDGSTARRVRALLAAKDLAFTPTNRMEVVFDSVSWRITDIETIYSGDLAAAYYLTLER